MTRLGQDLQKALCEKIIDPGIFGEWTAVSRWPEPNNGIADGEDAQKQHGEQEGQIEIVASGSPKYNLVRNVAGHDGPRPQIHEYDQLDEIECYESRREEHAHPHHALVVDQVKYVLGDFEVAVLRKLLLEVPTPARVHVADEHGTDEVHEECRQHCQKLKQYRVISLHFTTIIFLYFYSIIHLSVSKRNI